MDCFVYRRLAESLHPSLQSVGAEMKTMKKFSGKPEVYGGVRAEDRKPKASKQKRPRYCSTNSINKVIREIRKAGLQLCSTSGDTQLEILPKVLKYRGARGLNTYEGVAAGYLRIATRIKELQDTWEIQSLREDIVGPDGMWHKGVARYVLIGKRKNLPSTQQSLNLEAA
jgi:hypothetical protein